MNWLPKHECSLYLTHNEHKSVYESIEHFYDKADFVDEPEWNKAIAENSVWSLQWYPDTPIGFNIICAASLERLQEAVKESKQ